jgi:hypothetical protein
LIDNQVAVLRVDVRAFLALFVIDDHEPPDAVLQITVAVHAHPTAVERGGPWGHRARHARHGETQGGEHQYGIPAE